MFDSFRGAKSRPLGRGVKRPSGATLSEPGIYAGKPRGCHLLSMDNQLFHITEPP